MQFDFAKTVTLTTGGLLNHEATWNEYLADSPGWKQTAAVLTGPLLLANVVLGLIFSRLLGGFVAYGQQQNFFMALIVGLILAVAGFLIAVVVFNFLAGIFGGKADFSRAFAAVSLAAIPAWLAGIVAGLIPGVVGTLVALAGGLVSLFFMYKIMPLALDIPAAKRIIHFIVSIVVILVINMALGAVLVRDTLRGQIGAPSSAATGSGMLGEMERQGRLMEQAGQDLYDPPADGKLQEAQVKTYVKVMQKTRAVHDQYAAEMQKVSDDIAAREKAGQQPKPADLSKVFGGIGAVMSANNAEMEVVKSAGGNWAEHQWIKQQLRTASIQQGDGDAAIEHNYRLYQEYAQDLQDEG